MVLLGYCLEVAGVIWFTAMGDGALPYGIKWFD
jgi:hypothetical protein